MVDAGAVDEGVGARASLDGVIACSTGHPVVAVSAAEQVDAPSSIAVEQRFLTLSREAS
jgi:hypothetical protein